MHFSVIASESEGVGVLVAIDDFPLSVPQGLILVDGTDLIEIHAERYVPDLRHREAGK